MRHGRAAAPMTARMLDDGPMAAGNAANRRSSDEVRVEAMAAGCLATLLLKMIINM